MTSVATQTSIIKTYTGEMYVVKGQTPTQVREAIKGMEWVTMPNGDEVRPAHIASIVSRDSYHWQEEQKDRHKRGQRIINGSWHDSQGEVTTANLGTVIGQLQPATNRLTA